ncbi:macro domain-containing protein [Azospirillum argentinense]|uniref:Macro domain-containing protein n=1 Tax=Azospirillum argentinense TaxID=2970906 RepID=A0ABW8V879_9PROT
MLVYLRNSLFDSPAQTLVNTVNLEGVMGKGIAAEFKARYPDMFRQYKKACNAGELKVGGLHLWRGPDKWVLNFPTKTTWRKPSQLSYIIAGLEKFSSTYEEMGITSISFPPLGCGNGQLDWSEVKPVMESYLRRLPIHVYVHDQQVRIGFLPEHEHPIPSNRPMQYSEFLGHIRILIYSLRGEFQTMQGGNIFSAYINENNDIKITRGGRAEIIPHEELEYAWSILQIGLLTSDSYSGENRKRYKSYLFSIIAQLPYVSAAYVQHVREGNTIPGHGLYLTNSDDTPTADLSSAKQGLLWEYQ